jgi:hypothetical protein
MDKVEESEDEPSDISTTHQSPELRENENKTQLPKLVLPISAFDDIEKPNFFFNDNNLFSDNNNNNNNNNNNISNNNLNIAINAMNFIKSPLKTLLNLENYNKLGDSLQNSPIKILENFG